MDTFELRSIADTALVSAGARLGTSVTIGPFTVIHDGVELGDGAVVGSHCSIGEPTSDFYADEPPAFERICEIGAGTIIRSHTVVYSGVQIGVGCGFGHRVTIREGSVIGADVKIGTNADVQHDVTIRDHVRIHSGVFLAPTSWIGEFVWLLPRTTLTNDPHPPSDSCSKGPRIEPYAVISADSVILPGITVGTHALVGASSLVTRDVDAEMIVRGVPARVVGSVRDFVCQHGHLEQVYPWPLQFRRGYPDGALAPKQVFE